MQVSDLNALLLFLPFLLCLAVALLLRVLVIFVHTAICCLVLLLVVLAVVLVPHFPVVLPIVEVLSVHCSFMDLVVLVLSFFIGFTKTIVSTVITVLLIIMIILGGRVSAKIVFFLTLLLSFAGFSIFESCLYALMFCDYCTFYVACHCGDNC